MPGSVPSTHHCASLYALPTVVPPLLIRRICWASGLRLRHVHLCVNRGIYISHTYTNTIAFTCQPMSSQQPQHTGGPSHHKVAIPRQDRRNEPPRKPSTIRQSRVSRACLSCRARKIRCNGAQPTCLNCKESVTDCVYASSRKDRLKTCVANLSATLLRTDGPQRYGTQ